MQHRGRREVFPLGTPNKAAAAAKAREIYLCLASMGWDEALTRYKAKGRLPLEPKLLVTVGEFISPVRSTTTGRAKSNSICRVERDERIKPLARPWGDGL
jgi:hypothetical protein